MTKRTYQPKTKKRIRKHGFLFRQFKKFKILAKRRNKKRVELSKSKNRRYK